MTTEDTFRTIAGATEASFNEKRSKFIAFAHPVTTHEEIKELLDHYQREFYNARHVCYAYVLGYKQEDFRANDDGEPSGTAGRPILGQIRSNELTDVLVVVVRYFGGIKLGTGGLVVAYKTAAALALEAAEVLEKTVNDELTIHFEYPFLNEVMRIVKDEEATMVEQDFMLDCKLTLRIRRSKYSQLKERLELIESVKVIDEKIAE